MQLVENFKNFSQAGEQEQEGVELDQPKTESAASHLGDIRSVVCEQSHPAGEQSRSLELRY